MILTNKGTSIKYVCIFWNAVILTPCWIFITKIPSINIIDISRRDDVPVFAILGQLLCDNFSIFANSFQVSPGTLIPVFGEFGKSQDRGHSGILQFAVGIQQVLLGLLALVDGKLNMRRRWKRKMPKTLAQLKNAKRNVKRAGGKKIEFKPIVQKIVESQKYWSVTEVWTQLVQKKVGRFRTMKLLKGQCALKTSPLERLLEKGTFYYGPRIK